MSMSMRPAASPSAGALGIDEVLHRSGSSSTTVLSGMAVDLPDDPSHSGTTGMALSAARRLRNARPSKAESASNPGGSDATFDRALQDAKNRRESKPEVRIAVQESASHAAEESDGARSDPASMQAWAPMPAPMPATVDRGLSNLSSWSAAGTWGPAPEAGARSSGTPDRDPSGPHTTGLSPEGPGGPTRPLARQPGLQPIGTSDAASGSAEDFTPASRVPAKAALSPDTDAARTDSRWQARPAADLQNRSDRAVDSIVPGMIDERAAQSAAMTLATVELRARAGMPNAVPPSETVSETVSVAAPGSPPPRVAALPNSSARPPEAGLVDAARTSHVRSAAVRAQDESGGLAGQALPAPVDEDRPAGERVTDASLLPPGTTASMVMPEAVPSRGGEPAAVAPADSAIGLSAGVLPAAGGPTESLSPPSDRSAPIRDRIPTPMDDPGFPTVLGLKISRWAQDGIDRAWLEVHPADMGPVAIQIAVDGQQARLDFGAESSAARQLIEASLPELASALQAAGMTLSGGGIFEQLSHQGRQDSSEPQGPAQPTRERPAGVDAMAGTSATAPTLRRPRASLGLLDTYA